MTLPKPKTPADFAALEKMALELTKTLAQGMAYLSVLAHASPSHAAHIVALVRKALDEMPTEN